MRFALDLPPGLIGDDTSLASAGRWKDGSNIRFWRARPQTVGGWESIMAALLSGVCRTVFPWSGLDSNLSIAFGTHSHLQVWVGGELADITPEDLTPGQIDGTGGSGYGTGAYGVGAWGEPSTTEYFPRTWSFGAWGEQLVASPRDGTVYHWENGMATRATAIANAPANITYLLVTPTDQLMALGCNEEVSGDFNPRCIRTSDIRDLDVWNTDVDTTAREDILPGGGRIVSGRVMGDNVAIWTDSSLYLATFSGAIDQPWRFDKVADNCGLIGPAAVTLLGQTAYWLGSDRQFRAYSLGSAPIVIPCPLRSNINENLAPSQGDKIVASSCAQYGEVRFDYPDVRDGFENSRYLALCTVGDDAGAWSKGVMPRTAYVDAGPSQYPCGVTLEGNVYWQERGTSADGAPYAWFAETGDQVPSKDATALIRAMWPDFEGQIGGVSLTIFARFKPQQDETRFGPYAMTPGQEKQDLRVSGRFFRVRYEGDSSPTGARIGTPIFDLTATGTR
jgi:hypothetical protein